MRTETERKKYVPPHRREERGNPPKARSEQTQAAGKLNPEATFTAHAKLRQQQRGISSREVESVMTHGVALTAKTSTTFVDRSTVAVVAKDKQQVITVVENKRNTRFDMTRVSKAKEQALLEQIRRDKKNDHALCDLAELYLSGDLGDSDVKKAHELLLNAIKRNNSHAMCLLAGMYEDGDFGQVDLVQWEVWLKKAAKFGNKYANAVIGQFYLGKYLKLGENERMSIAGQEKMKEILGFLNNSAKKGSTRALYQIAEIFEEGWGCEKDLNKALKIYADAARTGSPASLEKLQDHVDEGNFSADELEAILEEASPLVGRTSSDLAVNLGFQQIKGELGKKPQRGIAMLEMAASNSNTDAMLYLARCFRDGLGCEPNIEKSTQWFYRLRSKYLEAVNKGNVNALLQLVDLYVNQEFPEANILEFETSLKRLEKLLINASSSSCIDTIYRLINLYITGRLGDHDPSKAIIWRDKLALSLEKKAVEEGDIDSALCLRNLYLSNDSRLRDYQKAKQWLIFLIEKKKESFLDELLFLYLRGKLTKSLKQDQNVFSEGELALIKNLAVSAKDPLALIFLGVLYREGRIDQEKAIEIERDKESVERDLLKKAEASTVIFALLLKLYRRADSFKKEEKEITKFIILAACSTKGFLTASMIEKELNHLLNVSDATSEQKNHILLAMLELSKEIEPKSPFRLGRLLGDAYFEGILVERNLEEAIKWYTQAAELENSLAAYQLGVIYYSIPEIRDIKKSVYWLESCTSSVTIDLLYRLNQSDNLPPEIKVVLEFELRDYSSGYELSRRSSQAMYELGDQCQRDAVEKPQSIHRAAFWFRKAAERDHVEASFELGKLFESGQLGQHTRPVAVNCFKQAAKQGHTESIRRMVSIFKEGSLVPADTTKAEKWQRRLSTA